MRSTYQRAMMGSKHTAPSVKKRWVYLLIAGLVLASALLARSEAEALFTQPIGAAVVISIGFGFLTKGSTALTPWALVCAAVVAYGIDQATDLPSSAFGIAQIVLVVLAAVVGMFQLRVELDGHQANRPPRTRWGSVLVATTTCVVLIALSRPDITLVGWIRGDVDPPADKPRVLGSGFTAPVKVGRLRDAAIIESSGLAASATQPTLLWTHNDSGDEPTLYCLRESGASCGTWAVAGASAYDWEDMASGPGPHAGTYLYLGDIGDNEKTRESITVYRVPEPEVDATSTGGTTAPAEAIELIYPDRSHDAEMLLVHPKTGDLYVVTKEPTSRVYKASAPLTTSSVTELEKVGKFSIFATLADRTGGAISPDGRRVAISTYGGWYELTLPSGVGTSEFDEIWRTTPARISSSAAGQTEAITYSLDGDSVFMTVEGKHAPIFRADRRG